MLWVIYEYRTYEDIGGVVRSEFTAAGGNVGLAGGPGVGCRSRLALPQRQRVCSQGGVPLQAALHRLQSCGLLRNTTRHLIR